MSKIKFSFNDFMNWLFAFVIFITSGVVIFFNHNFDTYNETIKDIWCCAFGISTLATIYTSYLLYKNRIKEE